MARLAIPFAIAGLVVLLLVLASTAVAADEQTSMLTDSFSKAIAKAAHFDYYSGEADSKTVFLQDLRWRDCALSECGTDECTYGNLNAVTDFVCTKEGADEGLSDFMGMSGKTGSCSWKYSFFRGEDDLPPPFRPPVDGLPNTFKMADIFGTCYFTDPQGCASPICNKMAISFQGGLYLTTAASHYPANTIEGPVDYFADPTCCNLSDEFFGGVLNDYCSKRRTSGDAKKARKAGAGAAKRSAAVKKYIELKKQRKSGGGNVNVANVDGGDAKVANLGGGSVSVSIPGPIYGGTAWVIAGPMQVTNPAKGDQYKENGFLEFTPYDEDDWEQLPAGEGVPPDAHWVKPGGYKLRFFREEEFPGSEGHDGPDGHKHEGDDRSY